jgi:poly-gamma-glutamate synthesis protein (capsule biosynthesis protein)
MIKNYRYYADLGASVVIGHHTHEVSGFEIYKDVPIFYSLGNFIFDYDRKLPEAWYEGVILKLRLSTKKDISFELHPIHQYRQGNVGVQLMNDQDRKDFMAKIEEYSRIIRDEDKVQKKFEAVISKQLRRKIPVLLSYSPVENKMIKLGVPAKYFRTRKNFINLLNNIRTEAHREVALSVLEKKIEEL